MLWLNLADNGMPSLNPIRSVRRALAGVVASAMKLAGVVTPVRTEGTLANIANPIRGLTPETLITQLDQFEMGRIKDAAKTWSLQEKRDDTLRTVSRKAKSDVARLPWEIVKIEGADDAVAEHHRQALLGFYNNLRVTDVLRRNVRGGVRLLVQQMMDAAGKGYAVHETIWKPVPGKLRAEFSFLPLWYFEGTTGTLRFLVDDWQSYGRDLEPGGWLTTAMADPLMPATSLACLFKGLPIRAWLMFIEKFSVPGVIGTTDFAPGSDEHTALKEAVKSIVNDWAAVKSRGDEIDLLEVKNSGQLPHPGLIDYLDRKIVTIWRGADLATISKGGDAVGASLQGDETCLLTEDWAAAISETLNDQVDRTVLAWYFGEEVEPAAYFKLCPPRRRNLETDIKVDQFLIDNGVPLSVEEMYERYGRPAPDDGEALIRGRMPGPATAPPGEAMGGEMLNAREAGLTPDEIAALRREIGEEIRADLRPLRERVERHLWRNA